MIVLPILLILSLFVAYTSVYGAPWVPVRNYDVDKLLQDVGIKKDTHYLELGCGDGRLVKAAAKKGAYAEGVEFNPLLFCYAWLNCCRQSNAKIRFANFWKIDLSAADVVMAFLVPRTMPRLDKKAQKEMKKNSLLVSYVFEIPDRKPYKKSKSWLIYKY